MSVIRSRNRRLVQFYRSGPMPCPYLPDRVERKLFTRLPGPDMMAHNSQLSRAGFRRSHDIVYRPVCPGCRACVPVRIDALNFDWSRSMRRIRVRNQDLTLIERPAQATVEHFALFTRYQRSRHGDSEMARMGPADYAAMIEEGGIGARLFTLDTDDGQVLGAILADLLDDGYSAVYSFFDPAAADRSLGTELVLRLVRRAAGQALPFVYLGYWIGGSRKMAYKTRFRPLEALGPDGWEVMTTGKPPGSLG
jgi:arginine-tRNA-protein transferase